MANLTPEARNDDVVMLELSDYVKGGPGGKSNEQAQQLLNKITWLDIHINTLLSEYSLYETGKINTLQGLKNTLLRKVELLKGKSDVADVVSTYADLQNYDTSKLYDNDIVKVLADSTHDRMCTYYRWSTVTDTFSFIGAEAIILPIIINSASTVTPDDDYTYVVNGVTLTLNDAYDGCCITVVSTGSSSIVYSGNTLTLGSGETIEMYYVNNKWIVSQIDILNITYPTGTVYISINDVAPDSFVGGTWERLESGRVIITSGDSSHPTGGTAGYNNIDINMTGTVDNHSVTLAEMPYHAHDAIYKDMSYQTSTHQHGYQYTSLSVETAYAAGGQTRWRNSSGSVNTGYVSADHVHGFDVQTGGVAGANSAGHNHGTATVPTVSEVDVHQRSMHVYMWRRTA